MEYAHGCPLCHPYSDPALYVATPRQAFPALCKASCKDFLALGFAFKMLLLLFHSKVCIQILVSGGQ